MLAGARLGDDPPLAHPPGEKRLAQGVVDLVRTGVIEVLALEVDPPAGASAEAGGEIQRRGAPDIVVQEAFELGAKATVATRLQPRRLELGQGRHQGLGDILAAVGPETVLDRAHDGLRPAMAVPATAAANASSLAGSLRPGLASTPLATSTA